MSAARPAPLAVAVENLSAIPVSRRFKRAVDLCFVVSVGIPLLPLFAIIALAIKLTSRGPVFYAQTRHGIGGRTFRAWKFRSMIVHADEILPTHLRADPALAEEWRSRHKLRRDPRITGLGRFLRRTSLDELPQFWNILVGEMSLVGPRPIVAEEISRYGEAYSLYQGVLPGLTGLWQVSGRNLLSYQERVALDLYILARTVTAVLFARGAY